MTPTLSRNFVRVAAWLLTPVVVWAASFFGGWLGAVLHGSNGGLSWLVAGAAIGGTLGAVAWGWVLWRLGKGEARKG